MSNKLHPEIHKKAKFFSSIKHTTFLQKSVPWSHLFVTANSVGFFFINYMGDMNFKTHGYRVA